MNVPDYFALIDVGSLLPELRGPVVRLLTSQPERRQLLAEAIWLAMLVASADFVVIDAVTGRPLPVPRGHADAVRRRRDTVLAQLTGRERRELSGITAALEGLLAGGMVVEPYPDDRPPPDWGER